MKNASGDTMISWPQGRSGHGREQDEEITEFVGWSCLEQN